MEIGVKRIIALSLVAAYVIFVAYAMITNKVVPEAVLGLVSVVVGYYFGKGNIEPKT